MNKVSTRVTLSFDVLHSPSLSEEDRALIMQRLGNRINRDGILQVTSQETRSQAANRESVLNRFAEILRSALTISAQRRKTTVSASAIRRRLAEKQHRSLLKKARSAKPTLDT